MVRPRFSAQRIAALIRRCVTASCVGLAGVRGRTSVHIPDASCMAHPSMSTSTASARVQVLLCGERPKGVGVQGSFAALAALAVVCHPSQSLRVPRVTDHGTQRAASCRHPAERDGFRCSVRGFRSASALLAQLQRVHSARGDTSRTEVARHPRSWVSLPVLPLGRCFTPVGRRRCQLR
jgi:hypothetical protein